MNSNPHVTICVPTYNCKDYVCETLISIKKQDYKNIKIKIFDNHSTDGTTEVLKQNTIKDFSYELETSEVNIGGEANFTRCILAAQGDYTALFHADDIYSPQIVSRAIDEMETNNNLVAVACHAFIIDKSGKKIGERFIPPELRKSKATRLSREQLIPLFLKYGNFITCPSVVARTQIYLNHIKNWNGSDYKSSADLDVWLRMSEKGQILFIKEPLMSYRESAASFSYNLFRRRTHRHDLFLVLDKIIDNNKESLGLSDLNNYNFLQFKDISLRSFNIIRNFSLEPFPIYNMPKLQIMKTGLQSFFHFKYLILGVAILFLRWIFPLWLRKYLFRSKENPKV